MRLWKLLFLFVLATSFEAFGHSSWLDRVQDKLTKKASAKDILDEKWFPKFWDDLRVIPVQFISRDENVLAGRFSSNFIVEYKPIYFKLSAEESQMFLKTDGEWEKEIDRKEFLKKFKEYYWLVLYFPDRDNVIYAAYQFVNWNSIETSYGHSHTSSTKSSETLSYWEPMRIKMVYFYSLKENTAYWVFFSPASGPANPEDTKILELDNNKMIPRRVTSNDGQDFRVLEKGLFNIDKNCIFEIVQIKESKIPFFGGLRTKPRLVPKDYFFHNATKGFWYGFYDKDSNSLLRVVEVPRRESK